AGLALIIVATLVLAISAFVSVRLSPLSFVHLMLAAATLSALAIWLIPKWQTRHLRGESAKDRFELENDARKTVAQILGGVALLTGLYFTAETLRVSQETLRGTQEGQLTERFARAVTLLGELNARGYKNVEVRLGGIYSLERIAKDSKR